MGLLSFGAMRLLAQSRSSRVARCEDGSNNDLRRFDTVRQPLVGIASLAHSWVPTSAANHVALMWRRRTCGGRLQLLCRSMPMKIVPPLRPHRARAAPCRQVVPQTMPDGGEPKDAQDAPTKEVASSDEEPSGLAEATANLQHKVCVSYRRFPIASAQDESKDDARAITAPRITAPHMDLSPSGSNSPYPRTAPSLSPRHTHRPHR